MAASRNLVLAVNAGSSSLKISVFKPSPADPAAGPDAEPVTLLLTASFTNISSPPTLFSFSSASQDTPTATKDKEEVPGADDHERCFEHFLSHLHDATPFARDHVARVCHRVVHGGRYPKAVVIADETYHHIESLSDLAPLHNGAALAVIKTCLRVLPDAKSIAFFDSAFHSTIPEHISKYAIDPEVAEKKGLKKYGFHGLSYAYILRAVAAHLGKPPAETTLIALHIGSGASVCAIRAGASLDTSMGLTPLDGLPGATRAGAVDASLIFHYTAHAARISHGAAQQMHITEAEQILNKQAGWRALAGTTDFRLIAARDTPARALAFALLTDRILNFAGAYFLKLGGARAVDALVFAGGVGERSAPLRAAVAQACACLGFALDEARNERVDATAGAVVDIGGGAGGMRTLVCRTDEQLEMARQSALDPEFA